MRGCPLTLKREEHASLKAHGEDQGGRCAQATSQNLVGAPAGAACEASPAAAAMTRIAGAGAMNRPASRACSARDLCKPLTQKDLRNRIWISRQAQVLAAFHCCRLSWGAQETPDHQGVSSHVDAIACNLFCRNDSRERFVFTQVARLHDAARFDWPFLVALLARRARHVQPRGTGRDYGRPLLGRVGRVEQAFQPVRQQNN